MKNFCSIVLELLSEMSNYYAVSSVEYYENAHFAEGFRNHDSKDANDRTGSRIYEPNCEPFIKHERSSSYLVGSERSRLEP